MAGRARRGGSVNAPVKWPSTKGPAEPIDHLMADDERAAREFADWLIKHKSDELTYTIIDCLRHPLISAAVKQWNEETKQCDT